MDNRHHWQDVTVGSLAGLLFSYFSYRQYFPALAAADAHIPYEPRYLSGLRPAFPMPLDARSEESEDGHNLVDTHSDSRHQTV